MNGHNETPASHRYSDALRRVAKPLAQHQDGIRLLRALATAERLADRDPQGWATAESVYWLGYWHHNSQWCPLYAALCATEFHPGACARGPEPDSLAEAVYHDLATIIGADASLQIPRK